MKIKPGTISSNEAARVVGDVDARPGRLGTRVGEPNSATRHARESDPVTRVVGDVAEAVERGELARGEPAIHAVIERVVRLSMGDEAAEPRVREACLMLGDDPAFVTRVERMIDRSLASADIE
jgi:hypothetical protein